MHVDMRKKDVEILQLILKRFPSVKSAYLFGSRATVKTRRASDIDIAISAPDMSDRVWAEFLAALDRAPLIYHLDVIRLETLANENLRKRIHADGVVIYSKKE